jgi:hypothetical protein
MSVVTLWQAGLAAIFTLAAGVLMWELLGGDDE